MNKYEISLWEDFPDTTQNGIPYLNEKKLCVIGSDSMTSMVRAVEPKLINNVNGTNTFTFKMYYTYIDEITGESYPNPFISMLINERKVKVFWKDEWYDLLIKNIEENTNDKSVTYTCKDSYITELSRNGYNLEFTSELQNNNGTAEELVQEVLKGSGWKFDEDHSVKIYQSSEEPVYETSFSGNINAIINEPNKTGSTIIPRNAIVLLFKSEIDRITTYNGGSLNTDISVIYSEDGTFMTEPNEMVVLNGIQYKFSATASYNRITGRVTITATGGAQAQIEVANVSKRYRGKRYINSIRSVYDKTFGRYVNVYTDTHGNEIRGFSKTEFSDPLSVVNLFANSSDFSNTSGWEGNNLSWEVYPRFTSSTNISTYNSKGYLHLSSGEYTNSGLSANSQYLTPSEGDIKRGDTGGFHVNDKYVFRIRAYANLGFGGLLSSFGFNVKDEANWSYFTVVSQGIDIDNDWLEYSCTCNTACPSNEIQNLKLVLTPPTNCYVESVQFFKEAMGEDNDGNLQRMEPGQVGIQGTSKTVYKYYYPLSEGSQLQPEEVPFEYIGTEESSLFTPVTSYEKIATIEEKESNRFNILQAIAESFECWVRFSILHDEQGKVLIDNNGKPEKYVTLVEYVGKDLGWSFDYGIDLKAIKRKIISDEITTKVIVVPNQNEFAKNGFCTIARSKLNYSKEIFILNLDYYVNQGMLDRAQLDLDLYDPLGNGIGYFYHLNQLNTKYDENAEILSQKRSELLKQESELTVLQSYLNASIQEQTSCESDMMFLAGGVSTIGAANSYAQSHTNNAKVQSLANTIGQLGTTIPQLRSKVNSLESAINNLKQTIQGLEVEQNNLSTDISDIHDEFFQKYSKYIQEGTWIDEDYVDDDKYYLDGLEVAYTSSRPQIQYDINVIRLDYLEDFSSKVFHVGDVCYIKDQEFFNYITTDGLPYRLKIIISEITSYFDSPEKDSIKVQNYKTQFDDLFERIAAATQTLQFAQGSYAKAASLVNPDKTINFGLLQETFDYNKSIVLSASNQNVVWDATGITITDSTNSAQMLRLMSGGLFITNDGGATWKNAVRGDGISADVLTAGRINVGEIYIYNEEFPTFRWDSQGLTAYSFGNGSVNFNKFVRHDQYGFYGYDGNSDFVPNDVDDIQNNAVFGLTWNGFFMNAKGNNGSVIINSNDSDGKIIKVKAGTNETFYLNKKGDVWLSGTVYANAGKIGGWTIGSEQTARYGEGALYYDNNGEGWNYYWKDSAHTKAGYYPKQGTILISPGDSGIEYDSNPRPGYPSEISGIQIVGSEYKTNWRLIIGPNFGVDSNGILYSEGGQFKNVSITGTDNSNDLAGGFTVGQGNDGNSTTYGAKLYGSSGITGNYYLIVTGSGVRMTAGNSEIYCVNGKAVIDSVNIRIGDSNSNITLLGETVAVSDDAFVVSDQNKKHEISYSMEKYIEFYHLLKPAYFKMNHGTSNRFHCGFIAQDIKKALDETNLTTQDFAGFGIVKSEDEQYCALRYSEFISLNTYMIQKAYKRIEALEAEIQNLKSNKNEE